MWACSEANLCSGLCRGSVVDPIDPRPLGERVGSWRPFVREESVVTPGRPGEGSPVPLEPEESGEAPCVGEVGERRPAIPRPGWV